MNAPSPNVLPNSYALTRRAPSTNTVLNSDIEKAQSPYILQLTKISN
jgi:hypothetical protein